MIETESIEEFSPTKNWEAPIRNLVRLASLLLIVLLLIRYFLSFNLDVQLTDLLSFSSDILLFFVFSVYVGGLSLAFLQLRIVNTTRKKTTNLGGTIGLVGLFLTGFPFIFELVQAGSISSSILSSIFVFGISFALLGIFAEVTLLDETLIFLVRLNFKALKRYGVTALGAFLFNLGVLIVFIWPVDLIGTVVVIVGILIVWGAWFNQINHLVWGNRILIFRIVELSVSQVLILITLFLPLNYLLLNQLYTSGNFLIGIFLGVLGIALLYFDLYRFGVPERFRDFGKRYQALIQLVALFLTVGLIMIGVLYPRNSFANIDDTLLILSFRGFYSGIGLLVVYRTWFSQINHFVNRSIKTFIWFNRTYYKQIITTGTLGLILWGSFQYIIDGAGVPFEFRLIIPSSALFVGYIITLVIWYVPTKHEYCRSISTTLSSYILLLGLYIVISSVKLPSNALLSTLTIPSMLILVGSVVDVYIWRKEIYHTLQLIWKFNQTYYREIVTLFSVGLGSVIWHLPDRHSNFRGVVTTLSTGVSLWGVILLLSQDRHILLEELLSRGVIMSGVVANVIVWRVEIWNIFTRTVNALKEAFVNIIITLINFVKSYYREIVTTLSIGVMAVGSVFVTFLGIFGTSFFGLPLVLFLVGYCASVFIWRVPTRHTYFRGITTTLSMIMFLWGFILLLSKENHFFIEELLSRGVILTGAVVNLIVWRNELWNTISRIYKAIAIVSVNTVRAVYGFVELYFREMITVISVGAMFFGSVFFTLVGDIFGLPLVLFLMGYFVSIFIWRFPTRHSNFRGVATVLSTFLSFWGIVLLISEGENLFSDELIPRGVIFVGIAVPIIIWRFELWDILTRAVKALKEAFVSTIVAGSYFTKSYYREIVTTLAISVMALGSVFVSFLGELSSNLFGIPLILFLLGYCVSVLIWRDLACSYSSFLLPRGNHDVECCCVSLGNHSLIIPSKFYSQRGIFISWGYSFGISCQYYCLA
jgi:hypothetical protein